MSDWRKDHEAHLAKYRMQTRRTMQLFSDQALRLQDSIIRGGVDREECDREITLRQQGATRLSLDSPRGSVREEL